MNKETFLEEFVDQIEEVDDLEINLQTSFKELPTWDSLAVLMIISMIRVNYGVDLSGDDVNSCDTIVDVYTLVENAHD